MNPETEADIFDPALWPFHNQKWRLGDCRQREHDKCSGDCATCSGQVMPAIEIERFDPFAFFIPGGYA
jgi:hypothetical protein